MPDIRKMILKPTVALGISNHSLYVQSCSSDWNLFAAVHLGFVELLEVIVQ
jgi:hypothetical protein